MEQALVTQLRILKLSNVKPNFSELSREYGQDRRTIKKYYEGYEGKAKSRTKPSKLDKHKETIKNKLAIKGTKPVRIKAVGEKLHIYSGTEKIAEHGLSEKRYNYKPGHYKKLLSRRMVNEDDVERLAAANLARMDELL